MCFHWRRWWHVPSSRIACSSDMFLKSGGYWEDLEPMGYEDLGARKWGGGVGTAAWPAASHWCVSRGWCRQLRFWLCVWSSQLGWRPWLAACPRGHSLHQNPPEAGAIDQIFPQEVRRGHQQLQDPRLVQERHVRGGLSPPLCALAALATRAAAQHRRAHNQAQESRRRVKQRTGQQDSRRRTRHRHGHKTA